LNGPGSPSTLSTLTADTDHEVLAIIVDVFFADDPFRCSPFMVTFGPHGLDTRPTYESLSLNTTSFPQIKFSLSRHLYFSRMTREGLDEFLRQHFDMSGDYLACADLSGLMDIAASLGGTDVTALFTSNRPLGEYTTNLYADMVVSRFVSTFYHDCLRQMQSLPQSTGGLDFSHHFSENQRQGVEQLMQLTTSSLKATVRQAATTSFGSSPGRSSKNMGATMECVDGNIPVFMLAVTERVMAGLKMANQTLERSKICACEMVQAMLVWYIAWAQGALSKLAATSKRKDDHKKHAIFESLRRIAALCTDLTSVARFCDDIAERIRPEEVSGPPPTPSARTPTMRGSMGLTLTSTVFFSGATPGLGGGSTTPHGRGGPALTPTGMGTTKRAVTPKRSHTPRNTSASLALGPKRTQGVDAPLQLDTTDITGFDVILSHLSSISDDLKLLSAQCLEHSIELATKITKSICQEHLIKGSREGRKSVSTTRRQSLSKPPHLQKPGTNPAEGGESLDSSDSQESTKVDVEIPIMPRHWAVEMETQLFQPLSDFCRCNTFSSENLLPRLLDNCIHSILEWIATDFQGKMTVAEARCLHADFLYLKGWMESEQMTQSFNCRLSELPVFDRVRVIITLLEMPPNISSWSKMTFGSIYLLPDAPRWIKVRADRGKVPARIVARTPEKETKVKIVSPDKKRLSVNINPQALESLVKVFDEEVENQPSQINPM